MSDEFTRPLLLPAGTPAPRVLLTCAQRDRLRKVASGRSHEITECGKLDLVISRLRGANPHAFLRGNKILDTGGRQFLHEPDPERMLYRSFVYPHPRRKPHWDY